MRGAIYLAPKKCQWIYKKQILLLFVFYLMGNKLGPKGCVIRDWTLNISLKMRNLMEET